MTRYPDYFPIELRNNGQKPIFELLVAQGDPLSASFYLYNVIRGKDHYKSQLANHLFNQWRLSFLSWVVWVVVLPSSRWDIESIVTQDTSISETPCVTVCICFELGSFGGHLLSIHSHFPVAEDRSSLLRPANLVPGRRAGGPPLPVLNKNGETPLLQRVLRTWSTEACQEHLFFSWGCKSWGDTPFDRVNKRSGSADECSCGVANGPRVVNLDRKTWHYALPQVAKFGWWTWTPEKYSSLWKISILKNTHPWKIIVIS